MPNQHWRPMEALRDRDYIVDVMTDRITFDIRCGGTCVVSAQCHRIAAPAARSEKRQEIVFPTPGSMANPVDHQNRGSVGGGRILRMAGEHVAAADDFTARWRTSTL
jgi:hypothetical protein